MAEPVQPAAAVAPSASGGPQLNNDPTVALQGPNGKVYHIPQSKLASMPPELKNYLKPVQAQPKPQSKPQAGPQPFTKPGLMAGFGAGLNPLHQTPENMPYPGTMGAVTRGGADMFNMREIFNRAATGDVSGAAGETAGTAASFLGPELIKGAGKGLKALGLAGRAAEEVPRLSKAAKGASDTAKELRVSPEVARFAERYVQPMWDALDKKFELVHKALMNDPIPFSNTAKQLVRRLQKSELPAVSKIGEELADKMGRNVMLDYKEAEGYRRTLKQLAATGAEHWKPQVNALAEAIDKEIDKVAASKGPGVQPARDAFRRMYGEVSQLRDAVASTAKQKVGKIRAGADAVGGMLGDEIGGAIKGGLHTGSQTEMKIAPVVEAQAKRLAKKLGVDMGELVSKPGTAEKVGGAMAKGGMTAQMLPLYRAIMSMFGGQSQPPKQ